MKTTSKSTKVKSPGKSRVVPTGLKTALSVSPSAWMVWEKCALSLQAVKSPLVLERDEYAKEGTRLHTLIEKTLKGESSVIEDSDDAALVRFAVETVRSASHPCTLHTEKPLLSIVKGVAFSGIADCLFCAGETIYVIDFKTGWREVEAEGNSQLKLYAHIAVDKQLAENKDWKPKSWKGIIINARFNSVTYAGGEVDPNYLSNTAKDILARTAKKQFQPGSHCAYCQRLTTCSKIRAEIAKWIKPGAIDSITREPERLSEALRLAKPAEKLFETIKKEAQLFIDLGGAIPGVSIEYTTGTRAWPRDLTISGIAERIGIKDVKKMYDEKVISPAQAEKIGADKESINSIAIRPPRKGFKFI